MICYRIQTIIFESIFFLANNNKQTKNTFQSNDDNSRIESRQTKTKKQCKFMYEIVYLSKVKRQQSAIQCLCFALARNRVIDLNKSLLIAQAQSNGPTE